MNPPDRVGHPPAPLGRRAVRVLANEELGAYRRLVVVDPDGPRPQPGQFYMLATTSRWGAGEGVRPFLPRALSHLRASRPGTDDPLQVEFLLDDVGPGTHRLMDVDVSELWLTGPLGRGFRLPDADQRPVLVGGGVGLAPICALADELSGPFTTLLGFRDAHHGIASSQIADALVATDDGSLGHHGRVHDLLGPALAQPDTVVYACGPAGMLEAVRSLLAQSGTPGQLALESGMACGFGACFGCVVATRAGLRRVCVEGPVFRADELELVA